MSVELLIGPMFAGKSSSIHRIVNRYKCLHWNLCAISHASDTRYSTDEKLMNHDNYGIPCIKLSELMPFITNQEFLKADLVIVDEAQFFPDLKQFVEYASDHLGKDILVVGLDGDAERRPFGQILECIPLADTVTKLKAFCKMCGDGTEAIFSLCRRQTEKTEQVLVGGAETYEAVCRKHYLMGSV